MRLTAVFFCFTALAHSAEISGLVLDAAVQEPLALVEIRVGDRIVSTDGAGRFLIERGQDTLLRAVCVGYRPASVPLDASVSELEIRLEPERMQINQSVDVSAGPWGLESDGAVGLVGAELRNLGSVLTDDPLRAVHSLPGVAANDDFQSQFTVRGADFRRIGVQYDGILLRSPFHSVQGDPYGPSASVLNADMLQSLELHPSAPPPDFFDSSAAALDMRTRPGDAREFRARVSAGMSNSSLLLEGPLKNEKGSWIVAARRSYLRYLIDLVSDDNEIGFTFTDFQGRGDYRLNDRNQLVLSFVQAYSSLDETREADERGINSTIETATRISVLNFAHNYARSRFTASNRIAWLEEDFENVNKFSRPLAQDRYREWVYRSDLAWIQSSDARLEFGGVLRRQSDDGRIWRQVTGDPPQILRDQFRGTGRRYGSYVQQRWNRGRFSLAAGGRYDGHTEVRTRAFSPYASAGIRLASATRLRLAWGHTALFPPAQAIFSSLGGRRLLPERAVHSTASLEHAFSEKIRLRVEAYDRADRDLLARPFAEARLVEDQLARPFFRPPWENSVRGYSRGGQAFLQRRSPNGLNGWISYAWARTNQRDGVSGARYPADFDQRHTLTLFSSYRLRPQLNLSLRHAYGSGMPLVGFLSQQGDQFFVAADRNALRLPSYQRTDVRVNKTFAGDGWQLTLFGELINLFDRENVRIEDTPGFSIRTGRAFPNVEPSFPFLPSAGLTVEF